MREPIRCNSASPDRIAEPEILHASPITRSATPPSMLEPLDQILAKLDQIRATPAFAAASSQERIRVEALRLEVLRLRANIVLAYDVLVRRIAAMPQTLARSRPTY